MIPQNVIGETIYSRGVNQTITTAAELTYTDKAGDARTIAEGEILNIVDVFVSTAGTAKDIIVFQDANNDDTLDSGEELIPPIELSGQGVVPLTFGLDVTAAPMNAAGTNDLFIVSSAGGTVSWLITFVVTQKTVSAELP